LGEAVCGGEIRGRKSGERREKKVGFGEKDEEKFDQV
jgi:hypothetical protein